MSRRSWGCWRPAALPLSMNGLPRRWGTCASTGGAACARRLCFCAPECRCRAPESDQRERARPGGSQGMRGRCSLAGRACMPQLGSRAQHGGGCVAQPGACLAGVGEPGRADSLCGRGGAAVRVAVVASVAVRGLSLGAWNIGLGRQCAFMCCHARSEVSCQGCALPERAVWTGAQDAL